MVYEDEDVYAFLDIHPVQPGHTLIVPKVHSEWLLDTDPEILKKLVVVGQRVARAVLSGLGVEGCNFTQNNGAVAGQAIPHFHFHVIPRKAGDGFKVWHGMPYGSAEEAEEVARKIRDACHSA